jgi:hypothetical protein
MVTTKEDMPSVFFRILMSWAFVRLKKATRHRTESILAIPVFFLGNNVILGCIIS